MRVGQQVHLRFNTAHRGTVSRVTGDGRFLVTWQTEGRRHREPRSRVWYTRDALVTGLQTGVPA